ncbi:hypothetical protein Syun_020010 [Stephania yunnanensis]|uniref:Secreted protein n=1 Tax=Stephania yunnanensis TaxID=152371 RepID=A0AAP0NX68_9MAGN
MMMLPAWLPILLVLISSSTSSSSSSSQRLGLACTNSMYNNFHPLQFLLILIKKDEEKKGKEEKQKSGVSSFLFILFSLCFRI